MKRCILSFSPLFTRHCAFCCVSNCTSYRHSLLLSTKFCRSSFNVKLFVNDRQRPRSRFYCSALNSNPIVPSSEVVNVGGLTSALHDIMEDDDDDFDNIRNHPAIVKCNLTFSHFTDDDILSLTDSLRRLRIAHEVRFENSKFLDTLLDRLNDEYVKRAVRQNISTFMRFLRAYHSIGTKKKRQFFEYSINRRSKGVLNASLPTVLEFIRIMNDADVWERYIGSKYEVEHSLITNFKRLSLEDVDTFLKPLVILCYRLRYDRLKKWLCRKIIEEFDQVDNSLMKNFFRMFYALPQSTQNPLFITPWMLHILRAFNEQIDRFDFECTSYAACMCTGLFLFDEPTLKHTAAKLLDNLDTACIRHIEKAVFALTYFGLPKHSAQFYGYVMDALKTDRLRSQWEREPEILLYILCHLSNVGQYPLDLIDTVFSKEFTHKLRTNKFSRNVATTQEITLSGGVRLECPFYQGNNLDNKCVKLKMKNKIKEFPIELKNYEPIENIDSSSMSSCLKTPRKLSPYNRVLYCTRVILNNMFGDQKFTHVCFVLPHFTRANILFCLDEKKRPLELPDSIRKRLIIDRKLLNNVKFNAKVNWYVVAFVSRNIYTEEIPRPMSHEVAKIRQFKLLNYQVVSVCRHGWLKKSIDGKRDALKREIFHDSNNCLEIYEKFC